MNIKHLLLSLAVGLTAGATQAQDAGFVNLTPAPKAMTVNSGSYTLPQGFSVGIGNLDADWKAEAERFVTELNAATGLNAVTSTGQANVTIGLDAAIAPEGYNLAVSSTGIDIKASTPAGLYYAFQTIKKILPANVMAGHFAEGAYSLPCVEIDDEPRFDYRGFMLDVSRHFFTVEEVKRVIDVMAYYKLNSFHWHLTDDQGWRIEIPEYSKLTTIAATAPNSRFTDMYTKTEYWINRPYGPYFYTQDQLREVVAYAAQHHIEVIPEVEMPGHLCAAMTAYPEFSCNPNGAHTVWSSGGISTDVLNVADPKAVRFAKDIVDVILNIFPSKVIHIGGDETPTNAWSNNEMCKQYMKDNGLTNVRELQSHFIREISNYVAEKDPTRRLAMWNEAISAEGADLDLVKDSNATIYCWTGPDAAAKLGSELGLDCIYTPHTCYYINRKQRPDDPPANGGPQDDVKKLYEWAPFANLPTNLFDHAKGVQGTFWCERVSDREYLEWLMLPRLIAIAEHGWTPTAGKDWNSFVQRISADRTLLELNDYKYTPYYMLGEDDGSSSSSSAILPDQDDWYRLVSRGDGRDGRCIELLAEGHSVANGQVGRLWGAAPQDNNDYQLWQFREDPQNPGHYAMVCKALPNGSLNTTAIGSGTNSQWGYDDSALHYDIVLDTEKAGCYGQNDDGYYYYCIRSDKSPSGQYFNMAMGAKNFVINQYTDPASGNGGVFTFIGTKPIPEPEPEPVGEPMDPIATGSYEIQNVAEDVYLADENTENNIMTASDSPWASTIWQISGVTVNKDNSQSIVMNNLTSKRVITGIQNFVEGVGRKVVVGTENPADLRAVKADETSVRLTIDGFSMLPIDATSPNSPSSVVVGGNIDSEGDASPRQPIQWKLTPVVPTTFSCVDTAGNLLFTGMRGVPAGASVSDLAPEITNFMLTGATVDANDPSVVNAVYTRTGVTVTIKAVLENGILLQLPEQKTVAPGSTVTVEAPNLGKYYTFKGTNIDGNSIVANEDVTIELIYTTESISGIKHVAGEVKELTDGGIYAIEDSHSSRHAFRYANSSKKIAGMQFADDVDPYFTWQLDAMGSGYSIKNLGWDLYAQRVTNNAQGTVGTTAREYDITFDGTAWTIKNSNNNLCWDGQDNLNMVGWSAPGHPHKFYEFVAEPYFRVEVTHVDTEGNQVSAAKSFIVKAGQPFSYTAPEVKNHELVATDGHKDGDPVETNKQITLTYKSEQSAIGEVRTESGQDTIYDLQGRRLNRATHGLYIINGQKTIK